METAEANLKAAAEGGAQKGLLSDNIANAST